MQAIRRTFTVSILAAFTLACNNAANSDQRSGPNIQASPTSSATPTATQTPVDELAAARSTFNAVCAGCHKQNGEGSKVQFDEGITLNVPNLKSGHALHHSDEEFAKQIADGGDGMPAFKNRLKPEQINALVRFIRTEFQSNPQNRK